MYDNILINENKTIHQALEKLNSLRDISRLILFVIKNDGSVLGSLTDGDIRRSLADKANLLIKVGDICNRNFLYEDVKKEFLQLSSFRKKNIQILPILDKNKKIVRILDLEKIKSILPLECMIMAGGRGKRLSPLTDNVPKPMLPLNGKPILEHNIDRLIEFGIKKIYISVKYLGEKIQEYFGDGSQKGIIIEYIWEEKPLGTGGALTLVDEFLTENVLLMNSDLFTDVNFEDLYLNHIKSKSDMVVSSTEYKVDIPFAVLDTNLTQVTDFKEKPSYIYHSNAGVYILKKKLISEIPKNKFYNITDLMNNLVKRGGKLIHYPIKGFWIDIGSPTDYIQAQELIKHLN